MRGSTGGTSLDALVSKLIKARAETVAAKSLCMTGLKVLKDGQRSLKPLEIGLVQPRRGSATGMAARGEAGFLVRDEHN